MKENRKAPICFLVLSAVLLLAGFWTPSSRSPSVCPSKTIFDVSCPGCGLTRSVCALVKADFATAIEFHALGPVALVVIVGFWGISGWCWLRKKPLPPAQTFFYPIIVAIVLLTGYWLYRLSTGTLP